MDTKKLVILRKKSGAPLMECKKVLEACKGNLEKAQSELKKSGLAAAEKKKDRTTAHGVVESYVHNGKIGVLAEVNCETDFVAKNKDFLNFAHKVTMQIASMNPKDVKELLTQESIFDSKVKINDQLKELILKTGENIKISRFIRFQIGEDK